MTQAPLSLNKDALLQLCSKPAGTDDFNRALVMIGVNASATKKALQDFRILCSNKNKNDIHLKTFRDPEIDQEFLALLREKGTAINVYKNAEEEESFYISREKFTEIILAYAASHFVLEEATSEKNSPQSSIAASTASLEKMPLKSHIICTENQEKAQNNVHWRRDTQISAQRFRTAFVTICEDTALSSALGDAGRHKINFKIANNRFALKSNAITERVHFGDWLCTPPTSIFNALRNDVDENGNQNLGFLIRPEQLPEAAGILEDYLSVKPNDSDFIKQRKHALHEVIVKSLEGINR